MSRCYDPERGCYMVNDGDGWRPESGESQFSHVPVVSAKVRTDPETAQAFLIVHLKGLRRWLAEQKTQRRVEEALDRERRMAEFNVRYLL